MFGNHICLVFHRLQRELVTSKLIEDNNDEEKHALLLNYLAYKAKNKKRIYSKISLKDNIVQEQ